MDVLYIKPNFRFYIRFYLTMRLHNLSMNPINLLHISCICAISTRTLSTLMKEVDRVRAEIAQMQEYMKEIDRVRAEIAQMHREIKSDVKYEVRLDVEKVHGQLWCKLEEAKYTALKYLIATLLLVVGAIFTAYRVFMEHYSSVMRKKSENLVGDIEKMNSETRSEFQDDLERKYGELSVEVEKILDVF